MESSARFKKTTLSVAVLLVILYGLSITYHRNYLLFHTLAELYSVIIACGIFMLTWNSRRFLDNQYLLFLGIAYLFIGLLDLAHLLTYEGINILPGYDANTPTQLWIAARYLESLTLLVAPVMFFRRWRIGWFLVSYALITVLVLESILVWRIFPDCFLKNAGGLTPFKIYSEYVISLIMLLAGVLVLHFREKFDTDVLVWMLASISLMIVSELAFTTYVTVYSLSNMLGHILKIGSFYCVYKALIATGLIKPYNLLFRDLNQSRDNYRTLFTNMVVGFARHRMIYDKNGRPVDYRFLETNDAFERLTGLFNVAGRLVTEVIPGIETDPADWIGIYGRVATSGTPVQFDNYAKELDRWYSVTAYSSSKGYFTTIFDDITTRKQAENELRNQRESMRISEARFKILSITAGRLLATNKPQLIVNDLCRTVREHLDCQIFFNYLADESSGRLRLNAWEGISSIEAQKIQWLDYSSTICGDVALQKQVMIAEDISVKNNNHIDHIKKFDIQAYCCHPLMVGEQVLGILSFGTKTRSRFTADEVDLMGIVAAQVAMAIHREKTEEFLRHHNDNLEATVKERTATLAKMVDTLEGEIVLRETAEVQLYKANQELTEKADELRRLAGELTMAEQRERKRLSQVLHDGLQQYLAIAKLQMGCLIDQLVDDDTKQTAEDIVATIGESIQISRSLSAELSPPALFEGGLVVGLKWLAGWMRKKHDLNIELDLEDITEPPEDIRILVFESIRELLFNTVKHAGVSQAQLKLESMNGRGAQIVVSDQGVGFNMDEISCSNENVGFGLLSIRERIKLIGGSFEISSAPGRGSRFALAIPHKPLFTESVETAGIQPLNDFETKIEKPQAASTNLRVMVADDHALFRVGTARLIDSCTDMEVVAQASSGEEACRLAWEHRPDVILMDINMPGLNGFEATHRILSDMPHISIIGLSMHDDPENTAAMFAAGAVDYRTKDCSASELISAIRSSRDKTRGLS